MLAKYCSLVLGPPLFLLRDARLHDTKTHPFHRRGRRLQKPHTPVQERHKQRQMTVPATTAEAKNHAASAQAGEIPRLKPLTYGEKKELPKLELQIEAAEAEVARLEAELGDAATWAEGPARGVVIEVELRAARELAHALLARWEALMERSGG